MSRTPNPGPSLSHLGAVTLGTPDIETSLWFFADVLGMEVTAQGSDIAYLRGYQEHGHHSLVLQSGPAVAHAFSFRVRRPQDLHLFAQALDVDEIEHRLLPAGADPGRGEAVRFLLPGGQHPLELYHLLDRHQSPTSLRSSLRGNSSRRRGFGISRLDHANLLARPSEVNATERWLRERLGFRRRELAYVPQYPGQLLASWLSLNSKLHDLAIGASSTADNALFHHLALRVESLHDVLTVADSVRDLGIEVDAGPGKHGIGQAMYLYLKDPGSGHRIEIYSGGYAIFDPDWAPRDWTGVSRDRLTWYGDLPDVNPESSYVSTTPCAGLFGEASSHLSVDSS